MNQILFLPYHQLLIIFCSQLTKLDRNEIFQPIPLWEYPVLLNEGPDDWELPVYFFHLLLRNQIKWSICVSLGKGVGVRKKQEELLFVFNLPLKVAQTLLLSDNKPIIISEKIKICGKYLCYIWGENNGIFFSWFSCRDIWPWLPYTPWERQSLHVSIRTGAHKAVPPPNKR